MGLFEKWVRPKPPEKQAPSSRRVEIPQGIQESEKMLAKYLAALERLEAEERGVRLDDFDVQLQPEDHRKIDELRGDANLRTAVREHREQQEAQRRVA